MNVEEVGRVAINTTVSGTAHPIHLARGACYLIRERKPELAYRLFDHLRKREEEPCLVVTRQYPARLRQDRDLEGVRVIWLSHTPGRENQNPSALGTLAKSIAQFVEEAGGRGIVILDGFEFLLVNNGFQQTLLFLEHVNEIVMQGQSLLLVPIDPDTLGERELALLERNVEVVEGGTVSADLERLEVAKLLQNY
jgi:hypothetical protein